MREIFLNHEPLLLFVVIGLGYMLGQIKISGFSFGVAGVLFVGLAFGAWQPEGCKAFVISRSVTELGLILFVYAIGLNSGPGFFSSLRQRGLKFNLAAILALLLAALFALFGGLLLHLSPALISGVFCGSVTNTPALAAVTELIHSTDSVSAAAPAVGYSVAYPFSIIVFLLSFQLLTRMKKKELEQEIEILRQNLDQEGRLMVKYFEVRNPKLFGHPIGELRVQDETGLIVSRLRHGKEVFIPNKYTILQEGDILVAVGTQQHIEKAKEYFGAESCEHLDIHNEKIEMRRILVSSKKLVGLTIKELHLSRRFNAQITRLRRADIDLIPSPHKIIELGDRLQVVMPADKVVEVCQFFGDSERDIAELDITAITLGIALGVFLGMVPIPIPGGGSISLGIAGGPLVVALILGKLGRTGPLVWSIPLEASHAIRHIGLLLFLAGVGISAGGPFSNMIFGSGWKFVLLSLCISGIATWGMIFFLFTFGCKSIIEVLGAASGLHTQPASLARAQELSLSDEVYVTYAITYPVAMILKIILAQLLFILAPLF